jgi:hypothetical protein
MTAAPPDRYANALALPYGTGRDWFRQARDLWLQHWLFFATGSMLALFARWQLDFFDGGVLIVLSYFTDAVIFGLVYFAIQKRRTLSGSPALLAIHGLKRGRLKELALCGLWGLPAAAASYLVFQFGPELVKALVFLLGTNRLGLLAMLASFLLAGYAAFLASLLPNLAAIQTVRDPEVGFRAAGLWAFRGLRSGWRPLAVVFIAFVTASFGAAALLTPLFGHLPAEYFGDADIDRLFYWFPWPGLFVAMNLFVALLFPMADDLMRAADHDLSDEVFDRASRDLTGVDFVARLLELAGFALASLAAFGILFWTLASVFMMAGDYADRWLAIALVGYLWSRSLYKSAAAWRAGEGRGRRYRFAWMLALWLLAGSLLLG